MPTSIINIFTDASETGSGIADGQNPSEGQSKECIFMYLNLRLPL